MDESHSTFDHHLFNCKSTFLLIGIVTLVHILYILGKDLCSYWVHVFPPSLRLVPWATRSNSQAQWVKMGEQDTCLPLIPSLLSQWSFTRGPPLLLVLVKDHRTTLRGNHPLTWLECQLAALATMSTWQAPSRKKTLDWPRILSSPKVGFWKIWLYHVILCVLSSLHTPWWL